MFQQDDVGVFQVLGQAVAQHDLQVIGVMRAGQRVVEKIGEALMLQRRRRHLVDVRGRHDVGECRTGRGDDRRGEARAALLAQLRQRHRHFLARLVDAVADHRVEGVGHRHDLRQTGNLATDQSAGIAGAVLALMVRAHDFGEFLVHVDAVQRLVAFFGVLFDELVFERRQDARLQQHGIGNRDLADVMERGGALEFFDFGGAVAEPGRDQFAIVGDAARVAGGVGVALLDHVHQGQDGFLVVVDAFPFEAMGFRLLIEGMDGKADVAGQLFEHRHLFGVEAGWPAAQHAQVAERRAVGIVPQGQGDDGMHAGLGQFGGDRGGIGCDDGTILGERRATRSLVAAAREIAHDFRGAVGPGRHLDLPVP